MCDACNVCGSEDEVRRRATDHHSELARRRPDRQPQRRGGHRQGTLPTWGRLPGCELCVQRCVVPQERNSTLTVVEVTFRLILDVLTVPPQSAARARFLKAFMCAPSVLALTTTNAPAGRGGAQLRSINASERRARRTQSAFRCIESGRRRHGHGGELNVLPSELGGAALGAALLLIKRMHRRRCAWHGWCSTSSPPKRRRLRCPSLRLRPFQDSLRSAAVCACARVGNGARRGDRGRHEGPQQQNLRRTRQLPRPAVAHALAQGEATRAIDDRYLPRIDSGIAPPDSSNVRRACALARTCQHLADALLAPARRRVAAREFLPTPSPWRPWVPWCCLA